MYRIVVTIGLAAAAVGAVLVLVRYTQPDVAGVVAVLALVLLGVAVLGVVRGWEHGFAAAPAVFGTVLAGVAVWAEVRNGWPGPGAATLVGGALVVTAGAVVGAGRPAPPRTGASGRVPPAGIAAVALLVVVAVSVAGTPLLARVPVHAVVDPAAAAVPPAIAPPSGPLVQRWRWAAGGPVRDVIAAGPGVVVLRDHDVVAVDTVAGLPRWSYGRAGGTDTEVAVSPDRRTVVLTAGLSDGLSDGSGYLLTVLDAMTGEVRWVRPTPSPPGQVTDRVVTTRDDAGIVAHRLDDGTPAWTAAPPPRCELRDTSTPPSVVGVALVVTDCPGPVGGPDRLRSVTAYDDVTGRPRWSTDRASALDQAPDVPVAAGGRVVATPESDPSVRDAATGAVVARPAPGSGRYYVRETEAVRLVDRTRARPLATVDPETGRALPYTPCPGPTVGGSTATGSVSLCRNAEGEQEVRAAGQPPHPVVLAEPAEGAPYVTDVWLLTAPGTVVAAGSGSDDAGVLVGFGAG